MIKYASQLLETVISQYLNVHRKASGFVAMTVQVVVALVVQEEEGPFLARRIGLLPVVMSTPIVPDLYFGCFQLNPLKRKGTDSPRGDTIPYAHTASCQNKGQVACFMIERLICSIV